MSVDYDELRDRYEGELQRALAFSRQNVDFFTELKARALLDVAARRLGTPRTLSALDVGCGIGLTDRFLAPALHRLAGVDVAARAIERAARENPSVEYRAYDGHTLPFAEATFDLTFAVNVVQVVAPPRRPALVSEMARVTRRGGLVVVLEHNPLNPLTRLVVRRCDFGRGYELVRRGALRRLLAAAGLDYVEARFVVFFPWRGEPLRRLERALGALPLGAQHYVAARRV